jgi:hypothetical protein
MARKVVKLGSIGLNKCHVGGGKIFHLLLCNPVSVHIFYFLGGYRNTKKKKERKKERKKNSGPVQCNTNIRLTLIVLVMLALVGHPFVFRIASRGQLRQT